MIGVTVDMFEKRGPVNPWVLERVHTPTLYARLDHLVREADAFVAVTGSIGTLTEIFLAWTMLAVSARPAAPLVLMGAHWREWIELHRGPEFIPEHLFRHVTVADTPAETANWSGPGSPGADPRQARDLPGRKPALVAYTGRPVSRVDRWTARQRSPCSYRVLSLGEARRARPMVSVVRKAAHRDIHMEGLNK